MWYATVCRADIHDLHGVEKVVGDNRQIAVVHELYASGRPSNGKRRNPAVLAAQERVQQVARFPLRPGDLVPLEDE